MKLNHILIYLLLFVSFPCPLFSQARMLLDFNKHWKFHLGNDSTAAGSDYNDSKWSNINLPHDWSIEGAFDEKNPATPNQAALPIGIGWYRKKFFIPVASNTRNVYINFDGVYRNSEVWINGHYLGKRPNGYVSFRYELTAYLKYGSAANILAVKVDNSEQPNSRWYTGSGIYRKVWLTTTNNIAVDEWGTFVTTPAISPKSATISISTSLLNTSGRAQKIGVQFDVIDAGGKTVMHNAFTGITLSDSKTSLQHNIAIDKPILWSVYRPYLYRVKTIIRSGNVVLDEYETTFGIRNFYFDVASGFFLNGKPLKILGVCNHHDLGALGAAVNVHAIERQLQILKAMGCNAIRTAHNPPAQELLDLCDKMGFIVMDEAFDMWRKRKNRHDYSVDFESWHKRDLEDQVKRDRNHPSVFMWSIGNEIREQFDSTGTTITRELVSIIKGLDTTRPVTSALTENVPEKNFIAQAGSLDLLGFNYKLNDYLSLPDKFPGKPLIAAETMSALATRAHYDLPSDSIRLWPPDSKTPFINGNADLTVSAYDNTYAYWGSSHEAGWNAVKRFPFMSGLYVWSGFDFLGEPVPYPWPARSSYYGIIDLAGFPKDVYYMYQSEWTSKPVLHLFPHWNWKAGQVVDIWAYYNNADEVELFLNNRSLGVKKKAGDTLHVIWRVPFERGTLKAVSRKNGKIILIKEVKTAGAPAKIRLLADKKNLQAAGGDLSFITVQILDANDNIVPGADNMVNFKIQGPGFIAGVDNGLQTSMEPFKATYRKAFNGLCLAIVQTTGKRGKILLHAEAVNLQSSSITVDAK